MKKINYWICGASWGGSPNAHQDKNFVEKGIWMLGWGKGDSHQYEKAKKIKKGDRIAIKRMKGGPGGMKNIKIFHIGIVKGSLIEYDIQQKIICTVDWLVSFDKPKLVDSHGCQPALNGPYSIDDQQYKTWLQEIFYI